MDEKDLNITEVRGAKANISDLQIYGDGDTFALLCKASSQSQGWMKSTKVCNLEDGCIVQVTTQQQNPDGSYSVAEALTYVPGVNLDKESEPRKLVSAYHGRLGSNLSCCDSSNGDNDMYWRKTQFLQVLIEARKSGVDTDILILEELKSLKQAIQN